MKKAFVVIVMASGGLITLGAGEKTPPAGRLGDPPNQALAPAEPTPVLGYLETKDYRITIRPGAVAGYTIHSRDGRLLADKLGASQLQAQYPELHQLLEGARASGGRILDASLRR